MSDYTLVVDGLEKAVDAHLAKYNNVLKLNADLNKALLKARKTPCEWCSDTTNTIESQDYEIEQLEKTIAASANVLVFHKDLTFSERWLKLRTDELDLLIDIKKEGSLSIDGEKRLKEILSGEVK